MKILIYGAGVIGSIYSAKLYEAGIDITLLARGKRYESLKQNGVIINDDIMLKLKQQPYNLLLIVALLLFIAALLSFNFPIDLHFHDTYFVLPITYLIWLPGLLLFLFWLIYLFTKHFLFSKALMWIHILLSILCSVFILALTYISTYSFAGTEVPKYYYDDGTFGNLSKVTVIAFLILFLGQFTYFINLCAGVIKSFSKQTLGLPDK